jgi:hypothetical protein
VPCLDPYEETSLARLQDQALSRMNSISVACRSPRRWDRARGCQRALVHSALVTAIIAVVISGVAVVATAFTAIAAIKAQSKEAKANRQHAWDLAREERVQARRADAYVETIRFLYHAMAVVDGIFPFWREAGSPDPPDPPSDEDVWPVQARLDAYGSDQMQDLLEEWGKLRRQFYNRARVLAEMQREEEQLAKLNFLSDEERERRYSALKQTWGRTSLGMREDMEATRKELYEKVQEIRKHANAELRG